MDFFCLFLQKFRDLAHGVVTLISLTFVLEIDLAAEPTAVSLLHRSAATILIPNTLQARLRLDVEVSGSGSGNLLTAQGHYTEQKNDNPNSTMFGQPMFRLYLEFPTETGAPVKTEQNTMTVTCNPQSLWRYTSIEGVKRLERVVVKDLDRAIHESKTVSIPYTLSGLGGLGGLAGMVKQLMVYYDFTSPPEALVLEGKGSGAQGTGGVFPVWRLTGRLKSSWREQILAAQPLSPDVVPTEVEVALGRDDLFPYQIHYQHRRDTKNATVTTVARLVFSELVIGGEPILPSKFDTFEHNTPQGVILDDVTDAYIKSLLGTSNN